MIHLFICNIRLATLHNLFPISVKIASEIMNITASGRYWSKPCCLKSGQIIVLSTCLLRAARPCLRFLRFVLEWHVQNGPDCQTVKRCIGMRVTRWQLQTGVAFTLRHTRGQCVYNMGMQKMKTPPPEHICEFMTWSGFVINYISL